MLGDAFVPGIRADLAGRKVPVFDGRITGITRHGDRNAAIKLDIGLDVAVDILFAHPRNKPSASLHDALGLATVNTPTGIALKTDGRRETRDRPSSAGFSCVSFAIERCATPRRAIAVRQARLATFSICEHR